MWLNLKKQSIPAKEEALPGRERPMVVPATHFVNGTPLEPPFPEGLERAVFGLGCFWGAEQKFESVPASLARQAEG
jgi:peptide-methionine (S)-S-oxide reductase